MPISGSVELDEIELKIESETHKYFKIENKSLRLTRALDRDAVLKEVNSFFDCIPDSTRALRKLLIALVAARIPPKLLSNQ